MLKRNFLLCGSLGWCLEVFWTGMHSLLSGEATMTGESSLLMFPIYGAAAFLGPISSRLKNYHVWIRGIIYTCCIFTVEYFSGMLLKKNQMCPWDYSKAKFNIHGLIRLDYAPLWFTAGLIFEKIISTDNT